MAKKLDTVKGMDREWMIESAARTLKEFAKVKRDKALLKAAKAYLKKEIADAQTAIKS
jgi:hypothetical protein